VIFGGLFGVALRDLHIIGDGRQNLAQVIAQSRHIQVFVDSLRPRANSSHSRSISSGYWRMNSASCISRFTKVYIGNLASSVTSRDLVVHFSRAGEVVRALAITDK
jgi:hypothetical protein